jgi:hypothetical protein
LNTKPHQSNLHGKHIKDKASSTSFLYFLFPYWTLVTLPSLFLVVVPECLIPIRYCARNLFSFWALSLSSTCGYWGHSPNWMLSYGKAKMWLYNILSSLGVCESPFLWLWWKSSAYLGQSLERKRSLITYLASIVEYYFYNCTPVTMMPLFY